MSWPIKPSPQSIMGMMGLMMVGCVSIPTHEKGLREARLKALMEARSIALSQDCLDAVFLINGRIELEDLKSKK